VGASMRSATADLSVGIGRAGGWGGSGEWGD